MKHVKMLSALKSSIVISSGIYDKDQECDKAIFVETNDFHEEDPTKF